VRAAAVAVALLACSSEPPAPHVNKAAEFVLAADGRAKCSDWGSDGAVDVAFCVTSTQGVYCRAGATEKPKCERVIDFKPKEEAAKP
jgi:hypothetical protein